MLLWAERKDNNLNTVKVRKTTDQVAKSVRYPGEVSVGKWLRDEYVLWRSQEASPDQVVEY